MTNHQAPPSKPELFPWRLHTLLEDAENLGFTEIVSWLPCGRIFKVHDTGLFESFLTPRYFNQNHYKSFQRQLNIYGFQRVRQGRHKGAYFHDLFVRGKPDLCQHMVRTKIRKNGKADPTAEPTISTSHEELSRPLMTMNMRPSGHDLTSQECNSTTQVDIHASFFGLAQRQSMMYEENGLSESLSGMSGNHQSCVQMETSPSGSTQVWHSATTNNRFEGAGILSPHMTTSDQFNLNRDEGRMNNPFASPTRICAMEADAIISILERS